MFCFVWDCFLKSFFGLVLAFDFGCSYGVDRNWIIINTSDPVLLDRKSVV